MEFVKALYSWPLRGWAALFTLAVGLLFAFVLFPSAIRKTGSEKNRVVALQRAYTAAQFRDVLRGWSAAKDDAVGIMKRENIIKLDLIFPFVYALLFAFAYAWARGNREPGGLDLVLFLAPLVAGLFDLIENALHLYLLRGVNVADDVEKTAFSPALVFAASAFAHAKYALLLVSLIAIVVALVGRVLNRS